MPRSSSSYMTDTHLFYAYIIGNMAKIRPRDDSSVGGQVMRRSMIFRDRAGRPGPGRRRSR
ncbi:unnamed protein product [Trichogramma brassicae]|uniref:Uncharacterized protein n=1 Tax=Trichogramma brassicae TaxID=86971 RepID=A0A6H5I979_9HYME|nr:unnamed protein product [Trichogramma brassicae]